MNYGKKKAAKRQKQITSKSAMQAKRVGVRLFKALLLCIIVVAIAGVAAFLLPYAPAESEHRYSA